MKKKKVVVIILLFVIILSGFYIFYKFTFQKQDENGIMLSLLKEYYNVDNHKTLDNLSDLNDSNDILETLFEKKYKNLMTRDCYKELEESRTILMPEQMVKDYDCKIKLMNTDFTETGETLEGYSSFEYTAYLKLTLSNGESGEVISKGSISVTENEGKLIVGHLVVRTFKGDIISR